MDEGSMKAVVVKQSEQELAALDSIVADKNPVIEPK